MEIEHNVLDGIRNQALMEIDALQDDINAKQFEINELKEQQKKLRAVVKAASDKPLNLSSHSQKKLVGIRDVTRHAVVALIHAVDTEEFTIPMVVEKADANDASAGMAESTIARAINVLREEGYVRKIGVEGRAPVYKWVGE